MLAALLPAAFLTPHPALAANPVPGPMLAGTFHDATALDAWLVSEKLDGVRARWDGRRLLTRNGDPIDAPDWFTAGWPTQAMDGELWIARGRFQAILDARLHAVVARGGEGLVLHRATAHYHGGRSDDLLKYKPADDAEAQVVGYRPGKGKYAGMVGALLVEDAQGRRFALGSGLSDAERRHPPRPGSWVTFRYNGLTEKGNPRFARYLRMREDYRPTRD